MTYSSDIRLLSPMDRILFRIIPHRELMLPARLDSSPEENLRKKLTGRDRMRIITDASTAWEVRVLIRSIRSVRTSPISCVEKAAHSRNTATPISRFMFRLLRTVPVTRPYTRGSIMPTSWTASVASTIRNKSPRVMLFFIYSRRSGIPSFFIGRGW